MSKVPELKATDGDSETVALFVEESLEGLQRIDRLLLDAERGQPAANFMATVFRDMHTIKGTSGFLGFAKIQALAHAAEDLLSKLRAKKVDPKPAQYSCLLAVGDALRQLVEHLRLQQEEGPFDIGPLVVQLQKLLQESSNSVAPAAAPQAMPVITMPPETSRTAASLPSVAARVIAPQVAALSAPILLASIPASPPLESPSMSASLTPNEHRDVLAKADSPDTTVRVNVGVLDRLMNLIGELVLARNQMVQMIKVSNDVTANTQAACQRLNLVTSDLQEQVMKTRMQPVARVFEKIPRMVRDLARMTGKQVITQIDGTATEIDKALVEAIRDPVMHIVRNAVDHGIESPEERIANGKPPQGTLFVRASHEGGMVTIEVEDDGRGMDPKALRAHAVKKQIITAQEADHLTDREALDLVFRPGFSTAAKVTDISGRGVGMDVVRSHVERAGGQAEIDSTPRKGTTIRLKMPLTLAIIPALLVRTGNQRFAIPQVNLLELVYLNEEQSKTAIEHVRGAAIYRLRGEILPIVRLGSVLGLESKPSGPGSHGTYIVVLAVGARRYGLVVDSIHDTEEIVIKPLHAQLKRLSCYSGATVLGDGGVALILDVVGVATRAGIDMSTQRRAGASIPPSSLGERQQMVVFRAGDNRQCAVPLSMVARLEQISTKSIERVADSEVIQYRDAIMPIIRPEAVLPLGKKASEAAEQSVIVFDFGQMVGMAVNEVLDVVEVELDATALSQDTKFALGKLVIFDKTTLIIDVYQLVRSLVPTFVKEKRKATRRTRILLADDSNAMRSALTGYLRSCGYDVVDVASGESALRELRSPKAGPFDALVTDLEMPGIDGYEVISTVTGERPVLPVFAWTHHDEDEVAARAVGLGARACIHKLRREDLMSAFEKHGVGKQLEQVRRSA